MVRETSHKCLPAVVVPVVLHQQSAQAIGRQAALSNTQCRCVWGPRNRHFIYKLFSDHKCMKYKVHQQGLAKVLPDTTGLTAALQCLCWEHLHAVPGLSSKAWHPPCQAEF